MMRIGVDIGGTFTDITGLDDAGAFHIVKLPSTPDDQSVALRDGVARLLADTDERAANVDYLGHGTTVATNTLLELDGCRTALVVTEGFRDILEIGRQQRPHLYDLTTQKPRVLVPRRLVFEVPERISASGEVLTELEPAAIDALIAEIAAADVESVAICLLHSYRDAAHELRLAEAIEKALPGLYVSRSSAVAPEFREYERTSTTVINAYVGPRMARYVSRLADRASGLGIPVSPKIIQSSGGLVSPAVVTRRPVSTLLSGPSAGVIGAAWIAGRSGFRNVITFDMGGTSTDVCLVRDGEALTMGERSIEGYIVRVPSVSVHTVGAGGGSIAAVDGAGGLSVGPRSAGAVPGPAAYGRGGTAATVTDANVVLQRQNPADRLGSSALPMDVAAAEAAVQAVADALEVPIADAALGILRIADSHMSRAVRRVSVDSGEDPRDYALVAYGGAGPLHAVSVAASVGIGTVLVPPNPGTLCSLGLLVSDIQTEYLRSVLAPLDESGLPAMREAVADLEDQAARWFDDEGIDAAARETHCFLELRYARQNFELTVEAALPLDDDSIGRIRREFDELHEKTYGFAHPSAPVRVVNVRLRARRRVPEPRPAELPPADSDLHARARLDTRPVVFDESGPIMSDIYNRDRLLQGDVLEGPVVIEQLDTTVLLPPGSTAVVDEIGTLIVTVGGSDVA